MKKINELTAEELAVVLCEIANPVGNIFSDAAVSDAFVQMSKRLDKNASVLQNIAIFAATIPPILLGAAHKDDTFAILAALDGKTADEVRAQNGFKTIRDLFEVFMTDKDASVIFRSSQEVRTE